MSASWPRNRLTERLGIDHPILSGAFGGVSSVELTALISDRGGLGAYGLYGYSPERIRETVDRLRAATGRPFLVNLWVIDDTVGAGETTDADLERFLAPLRPLFEELQLDVPAKPERFLPRFDDQVDAVLDARPPVVGFVFGVPDADVVRRLQEADIAVLGTATTAEEAVALERAGMDAVIASGAEAGGHKPSFLAPAESSLVGTFALVPQVVDAVSVPVVAAGGVADGRGVAAALMLGAEGVQVGTAFLATRQSAASPGYRAALVGNHAGTTVLTRASSGRPARGIPNRLTREIGDDVAPFPIQNWLTGIIRRAAAERDDPELLALWCGQGAALIRSEDAEELFERLVADASRLLAGEGSKDA